MKADRVAVISDVHGNAPALRAVLAAIGESDAELVVSLGDVTWGVEPEETRVLLESFEGHVIFVNGNGERALRELRAGRDGNDRECWMRDRHSEATYAFLETFVDAAVVDVAGLGETAGAYRASTDPLKKEMVEVLLAPPSPAEVIEHAEGLAFRE